MSASQMVTINCDAPNCWRTADTAEWTATISRRYAREAGWHVSLFGGRDICPECWKAGKR